jgi:curli biogenesis system outer membrane secretion channel CsgG
VSRKGRRQFAERRPEVSIEMPFRRPALILVAAAWLVGEAQAEAAMGLKKKEPAYTPSGVWEGYFVNDRGVPRPVLQPLEKNDDKDWMSLRFTDYSGPRVRLGVMPVENLTADAETANKTETVVVDNQVAEVPVASLTEMLTAAVHLTNRFEVLERKDLGHVLSEQDLGATGRTEKKTTPKTGKILGSEYMIIAAVNEWTPEKSKAGGAGAGAGSVIGMLGVQKSTAEVAMSFRVLETETSKVLFSTLERATAGNWGFSLGGADAGGGGALSFKKAPPINYAAQSCIHKGIYKLAMWLKNRPWSGSVAKVEGARVYVSAGSTSGLSAGMELAALAKGTELFDPDTGESLGEETTVIGTLRLLDVKEKYSIAEIVDGCKGLKKGDRVELKNAVR